MSRLKVKEFLPFIDARNTVFIVKKNYKSNGKNYGEAIVQFGEPEWLLENAGKLLKKKVKSVCVDDAEVLCVYI